jgi:P2 family phage contractile tail tube protein
MAGANDVRKNLNLFVDGQGLAGQIQDFNAPALGLTTEDFRGGGMDVPVAIEMGMEKLTAGFNLIAYKRQVLALFGVAIGQTVPFVARELLESSDGTKTGVVHTMRGKINKMDPGTSAPGKLEPLKFELDLTYYKLEHGGQVIHEIDVVNMKRIVNGADVLAANRAILGL